MCDLLESDAGRLQPQPYNPNAPTTCPHAQPGPCVLSILSSLTSSSPPVAHCRHYLVGRWVGERGRQQQQKELLQPLLLPLLLGPLLLPLSPHAGAAWALAGAATCCDRRCCCRCCCHRCTRRRCRCGCPRYGVAHALWSPRLRLRIGRLRPGSASVPSARCGRHRSASTAACSLLGTSRPVQHVSKYRTKYMTVQYNSPAPLSSTAVQQSSIQQQYCSTIAVSLSLLKPAVATERLR